MAPGWDAGSKARVVQQGGQEGLGRLARVVHGEQAMGFWDGYRASLKSPEVEEPIDYWLHRPLGYVVAKLCSYTPISADLVTVGSILLGWAAAACLVAPFAYHLQVGALLILVSTVFDCADGQLARMRGTSSVFGRMLDGTADFLVLAAVVPASVYQVWQKYHEPLWLGVTVVAISVLTVATSSFHTVVYDHFKNMWMRYTHDGYKEGDPAAPIKARYEAEKAQLGLVRRFAFFMYVIQTKTQEDYIRGFDPNASLTSFQARSERSEAIYRKHQSRPWALCRALFGVGSLMIGLAVGNLLDVIEWYLLFRFIVLNFIFYVVYRSMQRGASKAVADELAEAG